MLENVDKKILNDNCELKFAKQLAQDLKDITGAFPINYRNCFYIYNPEKFSFQQVDEDKGELENLIFEASHKYCFKKHLKDYVKYLDFKINDSFKKSVISNFRSLCLKNYSYFEKQILSKTKEKNLVYDRAEPLDNICTAFKNGAFYYDSQTLETRSLHPTRHYLDINFYGKSDNSKILKHLNEWFSEDEDKEDKINLVLEFVGMCLLGKAHEMQKCLILYGEGGEGKSTLIKLIQTLFSDFSQASLTMRLLGERPEYIEGKKINLSSDQNIAVGMFKTGNLKAITTADKVTANLKFKGSLQFKPVAGHIFALNALPDSRDNSKGFSDRFIILRFNNVFRDQKKANKNLDKEFENDPKAVSDFFVRSVEAAKKINNSYTIPKSSEEISKKWNVTNNPLLDSFENNGLEINENLPKHDWMNIDEISSLLGQSSTFKEKRELSKMLKANCKSEKIKSGENRDKVCFPICHKGKLSLVVNNDKENSNHDDNCTCFLCGSDNKTTTK